MAEESLRNEIDVEIPYVDDNGTKGIKKLHIAFISQAIYKMYYELVQDNKEAVKIGLQLKKTIPEMGFEIAQVNKLNKSVAESSKLIKEKLDKIKKETEDSAARLIELSKHTDEVKILLVQKILKKNGIEDKDLLNPQWWEDCTDRPCLMHFIETVCTKDDVKLDEGKKKPNLTSTT